MDDPIANPMPAKKFLKLGEGDMPKKQHINQAMHRNVSNGFNAADYYLHVPATVHRQGGTDYMVDCEFGFIDVIFDDDLSPGQFRLQLRSVY